MPEWIQGLIAGVSAAVTTYVVLRIEIRFLWRDVLDLRTRIERLELKHHPGRRWNDANPGRRVRSD